MISCESIAQVTHPGPTEGLPHGLSGLPRAPLRAVPELPIDMHTTGGLRNSWDSARSPSGIPALHLSSPSRTAIGSWPERRVAQQDFYQAPMLAQRLFVLEGKHHAEGTRQKPPS